MANVNFDDLLYPDIKFYTSGTHAAEIWDTHRQRLAQTIYTPKGFKPAITTERDFQMWLAESLANMKLLVLVEFPLGRVGRIDLLLPQLELGIEVKLDVEWTARNTVRHQLSKYEEALGWEVVCVRRSGYAGMSLRHFKSYLLNKFKTNPPQPWPPYVYQQRS